MKAELRWFNLEHKPILGTLDTECGKFTSDNKTWGSVWAHKINHSTLTLWVVIGTEGILGEVRTQGDTEQDIQLVEKVGNDED